MIGNTALKASDVKLLARELGFDLAGIASAEPLRQAEEAMLARLPQIAVFPWMTAERVRLGCHPRELLPSARSIISLATSYLVPAPSPLPADGEPAGQVSRYAWGPDYHTVLGAQLKRLIEEIARLSPGVDARAYVDTGPLAERAIAARAGLGWQAKNTCLVTKTYGSWVFLSELVVSLDLEPDAPTAGACGECDRCLRACPTGALCAPYTVDASRCLSYLTIECRGSIPRDLRSALGNRVFGCDACQEACPVNREVASRASGLPSNQTTRWGPTLGLASILEMSETKYVERFRGSAMKRARRSGLRRNAAVVLGNIGDDTATPALLRALADPDPLVRGHSAWALGRIGDRQTGTALRDACQKEESVEVREEMALAIDGQT